MNFPRDFQVDATMIVDQFIEFSDSALPQPSSAMSQAQIERVCSGVEFICDASSSMASLPVRTYTILTNTGPCSVQARGQLLEVEGDLFRLSSWENGRKNCVGLFDRRGVIGLFEIPQAAQSKTDAA